MMVSKVNGSMKNEFFLAFFYLITLLRETDRHGVIPLKINQDENCIYTVSSYGMQNKLINGDGSLQKETGAHLVSI